MFKSISNGAAAAALVIAGLAVSACSGDNLVGVERVSGSGSGNINTGDVVVGASREDLAIAAQVRVPQGTQLFDENGSLINGDILKITIEVFDGTPVSEGFFDGGVEFIDPPIAVELASTFSKNLNITNPIVVDLLGFARINATVNGIPVKSFNPAISVTVRLREGNQGQRIANISVDEDTLVRRFEGADVIGVNRNVSFTTDHLSAFGIVGSVKQGKPQATATPTPSPTATPTGGTGATGSTGATGAGGN